MLPPDSPIIGATLVGIGLGLWLLFRGFGSRLDAARMSDTATSSIASIALGEVRVNGVVEPAEVLLSSALQDVPCVYYRSSINRGSDGTDADFREEKAVGFRVRDDSGSVRVFPRGGRWEVPDRFDESSTLFGGEPPGLRMRIGSPHRPAHGDREAHVAELLTVRQPADRSAWARSVGTPSGDRPARYREARVEPGDVVTVLGRVVRFADLPPESAGPLETDPPASWGNAAIPGFGIGRPVSPPELDPGIPSPARATDDEEAGYEQTFDLAPNSLVLASDREVPLVIALGTPEAAVTRHEERYAIGLLGAILAIGSAVVLALSLGGGIDR